MRPGRLELPPGEPPDKALNLVATAARATTSIGPGRCLAGGSTKANASQPRSTSANYVYRFARNGAAGALRLSDELRVLLPHGCATLAARAPRLRLRVNSALSPALGRLLLWMRCSIVVGSASLLLRWAWSTSRPECRIAQANRKSDRHGPECRGGTYSAAPRPTMPCSRGRPREGGGNETPMAEAVVDVR